MRICVFCGSNTGRGEVYMESGYEFGAMIAERGLEVVYGGARNGLMGAVANGALEAGGKVIGVLPRQLFELEQAHENLTDLRVVNSMHERKQIMHDLSSSFVSLPGGIGTMEEMFEVWTWTQLGVHRKPLALYNVNGFYDALESFLDVMVEEGFVKDVHRSMTLVGKDPAKLLEELTSYEPPLVKKWLKPEER
ncbi:LOG family protein [Henriciella mobilis]|uniref:Cytokinin riboside 5'-monophosphate phosphoribohydrolase n=1 Tax=Henriciella mobilis TaxID=2305467 RepID=A0A399RQA2_9PROT|nr:TIGR00730 family Rossman fold protein [Henriciella mobilis]RIJ16886.1 TIGR00730 family Rossman fold protein [Henriciella mobilis]RIJ19334.1 TIGR00730 family Rossman fold protein [Henriciella mobilis]RIJ33011.1 TIGR00730 family Rossman fold protein [Henriciella mobilis]